MTANKLKFIACVSMLIDHIGFIFLPDVLLLRYIGRLAMPIFAFFIGEGCRYTHNRTKYFLRVFALALVCQLAFTAEEIINGTFSEIYLNVLFTFCLAMPLCFAVLAAKRNVKRGVPLIAASLGLCVFFCFFAGRVFGIPVTVDYGIGGVLLPAFAVLFEDRHKKLISYSAGLVLFCALMSSLLPYIWFSLCAIPLICAYNGERGTKKYKWGFYIFYPVHLALLYGVSLLI